MITHIEPGGWRIPEVEGQSFTAEGFAQITPPPCPVCGATVAVQRLDVTPNAQWEAAHGRLYIAGMWECPHGCNPVTGHRMHYQQTYEKRAAEDALICQCSCGDETRVFSIDELASWQQIHRAP